MSNLRYFLVLLLFFTNILLHHFAYAQSDGSWRIRVGSGISQQEAQQQLDILQGISDVDILPFEGQYAIFVGNYISEEQARIARQELEDNDGIISQGVNFISSSGSGSTGATGPSTGQERYRVLAGTFRDRISADEKYAELEREGLFPIEIIGGADGNYNVYAGYDFDNYSEAQDYFNEIRADNIGVDRIVDLNNPSSRVTPPVGNPDSQQEDASSQFQSDFLSALASGDLEEAQDILNDWEETDPGNILIPSLREQLLNRIAQENASPTPEPTPSYDDLRTQALAAEAEREFNQAISIWRQISGMSTITDGQRQEAIGKIADINERTYQANQPAEPAPTQTGTGSSDDDGGIMIYIIIAVVVIVIIVVVIFLMKKKSSAPAPASTSTMSAPAVKTATAPKPSKTAATVSATTPKKPETPAKKKEEKPAPAKDAPPPKKEEPAQAEIESESHVALDNIFSEEPAQGEPEKEEEKPRPGESSMRIPTIKEQQEKDKADAKAKAEEKVNAPAPAAPAPAAPAPTEDPDLIFSQDFSQGEAGSQPKGWEGSYDYASLTLCDGEGDDPKRYMKYEKTSGTGSAFYSCKFEPATGKVVVEFDIRCDNKNKYLLGFYIEKDSDFRHSISTVVHRDLSDTSKVALRLQHESADYQLGKWAHIRFHIDLLRSLVDGYVDDELVASGVRLPSRPKMVNTLSIRDNLATEGILMIANVKVKRDK